MAGSIDPHETQPNTEATHAPAPLPTATQGQQLCTQALRREVAVGFKHAIGQCRLALTYSVVGWTGTLARDKIPAALANAPSVNTLIERMDRLEHAIQPFLPADPATESLQADTLQRIEYVRDKLLAIAPGAKATRIIGPVLDEIEQDAKDARLFPPQEAAGWAWSWARDDWFRWVDGEKKWIGALDGDKVDSFM